MIFILSRSNLIEFQGITNVDKVYIHFGGIFFQKYLWIPKDLGLGFFEANLFFLGMHIESFFFFHKDMHTGMEKHDFQ